MLVTATLLGSALLTLAVGLLPHRLQPRQVLLGASALMLATGLGFADLTDFWPLLLLAFAGTLNPTAGDVSVFLPTEQALLADDTEPADRTRTFARYSVAGGLFGALGALASGAPDLLASSLGWERLLALRAGFVLYGGVALLIALV